MEIEFATHNDTPAPVELINKENTNTPDILNNDCVSDIVADVVDDVVDDVVVTEEANNEQENNEQEINVKDRKTELSQDDVDIIVAKVIDEMCDFLTENTEFDYLKDKIINRRMRDLMQDKFYKYVEDNISSFIKYLSEDEDILEFYDENKIITYSDSHTDDIHEKIYEELLDMTNALDMAYGWLNWDDHRYRFPKNDSFNLDVKDFMIRIIIKYVFDKLGDEYEYLDNKTSNEDNTEEDDDTVEDSEDTVEDKNETIEKENNQTGGECILS
jgi:hypothetical protein